MSIPRLPGLQPQPDRHRPDLPRAVPWAGVEPQPVGKVARCAMKDGTEDEVLVLAQAPDLDPRRRRVELRWRQQSTVVQGWFTVSRDEWERLGL